MSLETALKEIDPEVLRGLLAEFLRENPEELVELEEEVAKIDPAIVAEMRKQKPLLPAPYQQKPPPKQRRTRKMREIQRELEPEHRWWTRKTPGSLNELQDLYGDVTREGEETKTGRRFIRWTIIKGLDKNLTPNIMEKIRKNVQTSFYMRHIYINVLRNIEDGTEMLFHQNIGSPWVKRLPDAPKWLTVILTILKGRIRSGCLKASSM